MVKISIVMPVYNAAEFLPKSIESVANQTLKDLELICVDDGSSDNSLEVLKDLSDEYDFIKIITQENQGSGPARNNGIKNADGEYIAFLDADDIFVDSNALEEMYNFAVTKNLNVISSNMKFISVDYVIEENPHYKIGDYAYFEEFDVIHPKDYGIPYCFYKNIYKNEFLKLKKINFPDLQRGQDPIFLAKVFANTMEIGVVPQSLYGYNHAIGGGVNAKINTYQKKKEYIQHFKYVCDILSDAGLNDTSDFYKIHLFRFLTWQENNYDIELFEIFNEIWDINNSSFDQTDFNYSRFIVPAKFYFVLKNNSEEFYKKVNKDFLQINIYDTFAIDEIILNFYLFVIYSYSLEDLKSNCDKFLSNDLKFKKEFLEFKVKKFLFNLKINESRVVEDNAGMVFLNNPVWKCDSLSKKDLKKCYKLMERSLT